MLYNKDTKKTLNVVDCPKCPYFDKKKKRCNGLNIKCFEYDHKTMTIIDPITKLPIKILNKESE